MKIQKIEAGGGVPFRNHPERTEVLLIFRRGVWDLPKGKKEDNETFEECAVREVTEEVGASELQIGEHLTDTYHEYQQNGRQFGKITRWYAMRVMDYGSGLKPQKDEQIEKLMWCTPQQAKKLVGFQNLADVLEKFEKIVLQIKNP